MCVVGCSGDPYFLEPFWMLERHIRKLHAIVGNAVTGGRYIVFGAGSTQLLNAAVHALSSHNSSSSSSPASVVASIPYYNNISDATNVIEFVTSPNNPDGQLNKANVQGPNAKAIYDRVYYWPHFTAIPTPANDDIMIFSISKLTGHAGSRFGWAVVKDESVFQKMTMYTLINSMGISRDAQLRALKVLNVVLEGGGKDIFEFGYNTLRKRWEKLSNILSVSNRFSLQKFAPKHCTFFKKTRGPSPAYAWVKCEREEDKDCYAVLQEEANVYGRRGSQFGAEDRFVRLTLLRSQDDFDLLLQRLNQLVLEESHRQSYFVHDLKRN
ncbi:unnamed protein product [Prunus armeniaca]|uniref:Alliinase C-terminal domain-containing protein n=1 Tax=Prunus armeniaca TaxID=36596 RepID=A0A6J5VK85_PRUAR|nr:unnamed protein product [Prunus armeniaca]